MMRRRGKRLRGARRRSGSSLAVDAVVVVGVAVSIGLIAVSALLNFRMGYRSADTEFDGLVYGAGAGLGDALKAIAPFMLHVGVRNRDWLAVVAAAIIFGVFSIYSFTAALGFAADHRATKAGVAQGAIDSRKDARAEKTRLESRLLLLGPQRPSKEISSQIEATFREPAYRGGKSVDQVSARCTLNRNSTRERCAAIGKLETELARAEEAERLGEQVKALRETLAGQGEVVETADVQVDALQRMSGKVSLALAPEDIGLGLSVLLALFVELGSGLGLYVSTTPWRGKPMMETSVQGRKEQRLGHVDGFVMARLAADEDGSATMEALFAAYAAWCGDKGFVPYNRKEFRERFNALANEAGMRVQVRKGMELFTGIRLT